MKNIQNSPAVVQIESRLNKYPYLSKNTLPGYSDGVVFKVLEKKNCFPNRHHNPQFYHWFIIMKQFSASTIQKWIHHQIHLDQTDSLINDFACLNKKESVQECSQLIQEEKTGKTDSLGQIEYTIQLTLKGCTSEEIRTLRKLLTQYKGEISQDETNASKLLRIICKIDPGDLDSLQRKISNCIQYDNFSVKRSDKKGAAIGSFERVE